MFHLLLLSEELMVHLVCEFISCFFAFLSACSLAVATAALVIRVRVMVRAAGGLLGNCGYTLLVVLVCFAF